MLQSEEGKSLQTVAEKEVSSSAFKEMLIIPEISRKPRCFQQCFRTLGNRLEDRSVG